MQYYLCGKYVPSYMLCYSLSKARSVMRRNRSHVSVVTDVLFEPALLMSPLGVKIPTEDFTDVTIGDIYD